MSLALRPLRLLTPTPLLRTSAMSTAPTKHMFLVYAPDHTDPDALQRRLAVRDQHLANAKKLHAEGSIQLGGAMVTEETINSAQKQMTGSTLLVRAETSAEVRAIVEGDVYYKNNVWDAEKIVITPFISAPLT